MIYSVKKYNMFECLTFPKTFPTAVVVQRVYILKTFRLFSLFVDRYFHCVAWADKTGNREIPIINKIFKGEKYVFRQKKSQNKALIIFYPATCRKGEVGLCVQQQSTYIINYYYVPFYRGWKFTS